MALDIFSISEKKSKLERINNRNNNKNKRKCKRNRSDILEEMKDNVETGPVVIEFDKNCQIDFIHREITKRLENQVGVDVIEKKIMLLLQDLEEDDLTIIERCKIEREIKNLKSEIENIISGKQLKNYLSETEELVQEYLTFGTYIEKVSFIDDFDENADCVDVSLLPCNLTSEDTQRIRIIENFISIASRYVTIEAKRDVGTKINNCMNCGYNMKDVIVDEMGIQICPECDTERQSYNLNGHKGTKNHSDSRQYEVEKTYIREIERYMGQESIHIPDKLYKDVDEYCQLFLEMPPASKIRKKKCDRDGKKGDANVANLLLALEKCEYNGYYKNYNKIGKKLWGWKLHDFRRDLPLLISDFKEVQEGYNKIEKKRSSNMCSQHRLLQQLRLRYEYIPLTDFKLPKREALIDSEKLWKKSIKKTRFEYKPLFPEAIFTSDSDDEEVGEIFQIMTTPKNNDKDDHSE